MTSVHQQWFICGWKAGSELFFFYSRSKEEKVPYSSFGCPGALNNASLSSYMKYPTYGMTFSLYLPFQIATSFGCPLLPAFHLVMPLTATSYYLKLDSQNLTFQLCGFALKHHMQV